MAERPQKRVTATDWNVLLLASMLGYRPIISPSQLRRFELLAARDFSTIATSTKLHELVAINNNNKQQVESTLASSHTHSL